MYGTEALQFFDPFGNVNKVNYDSSCNNPLCAPHNPKLSSLVKLTDIIGDNKGIRRAKIKISSYKEVCFTCNLGEVTRKVRDLPLIQLKRLEREYLQWTLTLISENLKKNVRKMIPRHESVKTRGSWKKRTRCV